MFWDKQSEADAVSTSPAFLLLAASTTVLFPGQDGGSVVGQIRQQ